jgi:glucose/arabinose dehydrogenase
MAKPIARVFGAPVQRLRGVTGAMARGNVQRMEPFMTGLVENNEYLGRPVDVLVLKDGSLLVSDDLNGAIYRISYGR